MNFLKYILSGLFIFLSMSLVSGQTIKPVDTDEKKVRTYQAKNQAILNIKTKIEQQNGRDNDGDDREIKDEDKDENAKRKKASKAENSLKAKKD